MSPEEHRSVQYMKVPNIVNDCDKVEELSMGAIPINPNNMKRKRKVLDDILKKTGMYRKYSVKLSIDEDKQIEKTVIENDDERTWILVSCDGLPMKHLISIVKNNHTCEVCDKRLRYISEINEHFNETGHNSFYQTYGAVLLNYGEFHYAQTIMRCYTKLNWDIDFKDLCTAINLASPKAQFMIEKGTDFRKSIDFIRSVRKAKIREILTPYVRFCKERNIEATVDMFYVWLKDEVKNKTYLSVYNIEKNFGTSLLLYISAMRSNNYPLLRIAKRMFSSLLHINNHPNYAQIDVWTDYLDEKMEKDNPELYQYLKTRRFTNKTGQPYRFEPHDERHEEFNKRGLNFQNNRTTEAFATSFAVVESYNKLATSVFNDYGVKKESKNSHRINDYEDNISNMRLRMRSDEYLTSPMNVSDAKALDGSELCDDVLKIKEISDKVKKENILKIIKNNDFFVSLNSKKISVLDQEKNIDVDFEEQVRIMISTEENPEKRANLYNFWTKACKRKNFSHEKFLNDLLINNYSFL